MGKSILVYHWMPSGLQDRTASKLNPETSVLGWSREILATLWFVYPQQLSHPFASLDGLQIPHMLVPQPSPHGLWKKNNQNGTAGRVIKTPGWERREEALPSFIALKKSPEAEAVEWKEGENCSSRTTMAIELWVGGIARGGRSRQLWREPHHKVQGTLPFGAITGKGANLAAVFIGLNRDLSQPYIIHF